MRSSDPNKPFRKRLGTVFFCLAALISRISDLRADSPPMRVDEAGQDGVPPGWMIIEGDILVPEGFYELRAPYATNLWGTTVPYEFDANVVPGLRGVANPQAAMGAAMAEWETVANVDFTECSASGCAADGQSDYLHIQDSTGNSSAVGRQGGQQLINIFNWDWRFIMAHELAHALGCWHEQSRTDRGPFIRIETDNICQTCCNGGPCDHNFDMRPDPGGEYGPYDFDSVMHYGLCSFNNCGCTSECNSCGPPPPGQTSCPTITVLPPYDTACVDSSIVNCPQTTIGQRGYLSTWDERVMSFLYPEANWVFADVTYAGTESGTFFQPYGTFAQGYSIMPSGGTLWLLRPGTYATGGTLSKAGVIRAPLGGVVLSK